MIECFSSIEKSIQLSDKIVLSLSSSNNSELKCVYCNQIHRLNDIKSKKSNRKSSENECFNNLETSRNKYIEKVKELNDNINLFKSLDFETSIRSKFDYIESDIEIRIESLKCEIDNATDRLLSRLNIIKKRMSTSRCEKINLAKQNLDIYKRAFVVNLKNLCIHEKLLNRIKHKIVKANRVQLKLRTTYKIIHEYQIGYISGPSKWKYDKIKSLALFQTPCKDLTRAVQTANNRLLITDYKNRTIEVIDENGKHLQSSNPSQYLMCPVAICINKNNEIIVGDWGRIHKIFVFNSEFQFLRKLANRVEMRPECMETDGNLIYVTDCRNDNLTVWNSDNGDFIYETQLDSPTHIKITNDRLFIISHLTCTWSNINDSKKIDFIKKGSNCVYVLSKSSLEIINTISFDDWLCPHGLYIDANSNLVTSAYEVNDDNCISKSRYLYTIDKNGNFIRKIKIGLSNFKDMLITDVKMTRYALFFGGETIAKLEIE